MGGKNTKTYAHTDLEIKRFHRTFAEIDKDGKGHINKADLLALSSLKANPLRERLAEVILNFGEDIENPGLLTFPGFCKLMTTFTDESKATKARMSFLFCLMDVDKDGKLSRCDMTQIVELVNYGRPFLHRIFGQKEFISFQEFMEDENIQNFAEKELRFY